MGGKISHQENQNESLLTGSNIDNNEERYKIIIVFIYSVNIEEI